jgi:hypothetical protein
MMRFPTELSMGGGYISNSMKNQSLSQTFREALVVPITTFIFASYSFFQYSASVDEGFHSPNSSRLSRPQSVGLKSTPKACYRPGLSRNSSKQQSLLSMFGFQKK